MEKRFWSKFKSKQLGPFDSRDAAIQAMRDTVKAKPTRDKIMTGYGNFGPHFDIQWHDLAAVAA